MKYAALLLLLAAPFSYAGDLELSLGVGLTNPDATSAVWAKPGCCYTVDYQWTKPNSNASIGVFGGKLGEGIYFLGPNLGYVIGPFAIGIAAGADKDHGAMKLATAPVIEYSIKQFSIDIAYLESTVHQSNGFILAVGYHFTL